MYTLKISIMVPDIQINHWGLHSWRHNLKITFFFKTPCSSLILHSRFPPTAEIPAGNPQLSTHVARGVFDSFMIKD